MVEPNDKRDCKLEAKYLPSHSRSYPEAVMDKITEMGEGIVVHDRPVHKTTRKEKCSNPLGKINFLQKSKKSQYSVTVIFFFLPSCSVSVFTRPHLTLQSVVSLNVTSLFSCEGAPDDSWAKRARYAPNETDGRPAGKTSTRPMSQKSGPTQQAPAEHQPFFNRLYKAVAWKLVSAGGFGPNLDHFEILCSCVESCKQTLTCVFVPLKDIVGLPAARTQKEGHVCEIRCQTVYMGTGYGRDESAARAMASKEALKVFQGRKVTVKIARRRYKGREVEDLLLLDEQPRSQGFPPALSYPFQDECAGDGSL